MRAPTIMLKIKDEETLCMYDKKIFESLKLFAAMDIRNMLKNKRPIVNISFPIL